MPPTIRKMACFPVSCSLTMGSTKCVFWSLRLKKNNNRMQFLTFACLIMDSGEHFFMHSRGICVSSPRTLLSTLSQSRFPTGNWLYSHLLLCLFLYLRITLFYKFQALLPYVLLILILDFYLIPCRSLMCIVTFINFGSF